MKKLLSIFLTLALCIGLMPAMAFATKAPKATSLIVGGVTLDSSRPYAKTNNAGIVSLGGSESDYNIKFDASTSTLTLKDANICGYYYDSGYGNAYGIWTMGDFTLVVNGDNTVIPSGVWDAHSNADIYGIASGANQYGVSITIGGNGTLRVDCNDENNGRNSYGIALYAYDGSLNVLTLKDEVSVSVGTAKCNGNIGVDVTGDIIIRDNAKLTVLCGQACGSSIGVDCSFSLKVQDKAVLISTAADSYNYVGTTYTKALENSVGIKSSDMTVSGNATVAATGGKVVESSGTEAGSYGIVASTLTINGGTVVANSKSTEGVSAALKRPPVLGSGITAGGSANADGSGAVEYVADNNDSYKWFKTPVHFCEVNVTPGAHMTKTGDSGAASQTVLEGSAITDIVYTADDGYYFPESFWSWDTPESGISVHRDSDTQITVSGTPTVATANFEFNAASEVPTVPKVDTPTFNPAAKSFDDFIEVKITCALDGATVYYTDDGSVPSATNGTVTTGAAITLTETKILKAIAVMAGYDDSDIATAKYTKTTPSSGGGGGTAPVEPEPAEPEPSEPDEFPFEDVPEDEYYREPVEWAVEKGITSGVSEDKYGPDLSCTRAQVVTFLWIACGSEDAGTETGFNDVDVDAYYDKAVVWAVEKGITAGTSENEFSPEMTITRAQFVTMLWVAQGKPDVDGDMPFTDVPEDAYYAKAVAWAYANDITAGKSADSFAPDDPCTRGQIMTFLYNAYEE